MNKNNNTSATEKKETSVKTPVNILKTRDDRKTIRFIPSDGEDATSVMFDNYLYIT